jgi:hypothetical protein
MRGAGRAKVAEGKMEYGKVLHRAWQIAWQWKVLWVLGFVASLSVGVGGLREINPLLSLPGWLASRTSSDAATTHISLDVVERDACGGCGMVLITIAMGVVSVIAWGGLIAGVQQVEDDGSTSFGQAWRVGVKRFWTLIGVGLLAAVPTIVISLILLVVMLVSEDHLANWYRTEWPGATIESWIGLGGLVACGTTAVMWLLWLTQNYAGRAAILKGLRWTEAFERGWQVLRANIGPTLVFGLAFLTIGTIVGEAMTALRSSIATAITSTDVGAWAPATIAGASYLLASVLGALIGGVVNTLTSVTWTLAYREMTAGRKHSTRSEVEPQVGAEGHKRREGTRKRHKRHKAAQVSVWEAGH